MQGHCDGRANFVEGAKHKADLRRRLAVFQVGDPFPDRLQARREFGLGKPMRLSELTHNRADVVGASDQHESINIPDRVQIQQISDRISRETIPDRISIPRYTPPGIKIF